MHFYHHKIVYQNTLVQNQTQVMFIKIQSNLELKQNTHAFNSELKQHMTTLPNSESEPATISMNHQHTFKLRTEATYKHAFFNTKLLSMNMCNSELKQTTCLHLFSHFSKQQR